MKKALNPMTAIAVIVVVIVIAVFLFVRAAGQKKTKYIPGQGVVDTSGDVQEGRGRGRGGAGGGGG